MSKRRIPARLLPHGRLVQIELAIGTGSKGRIYSAPIVMRRAQIVEATEIVRTASGDMHTVASCTVYLDRNELGLTPKPESRVTVWLGTEDERATTLVSVSRWQHPVIGDLLELKLK